MSAQIERVEKRCTKCGVVKPLGDFHRNRATSDGRREQCAACANEYSRARLAARREANPELERARQRETTRRYRMKPKGKRSVTLDTAVQTEVYRRLREAHPAEYEAIRRVVRDELHRKQAS